MPSLLARRGAEIMPHSVKTKSDVAGRVADMFRLAERDYDLTLKRLALLSGMSVETLGSYKAGVAIPLHAFVQLAPHIPDELLSLCTECAGKFVGTNETGEGDLHALGREAAGYVCEKLDAESDGVVTQIEARRLKDRARRIASTARRAAA